MAKREPAGKMLGKLEAAIMEIVWRQDLPVTVKDVTRILAKRRPIAYTTVMTVMARLTEKDVLSRRLSGQSYLYKPKMSKERFVARVVHGIFSTSISTLGEGVLAHFIKEIQMISPEKRRQILKVLGESKGA